MRIVGRIPQSKEATNPALSGIRQHKDSKYNKVKENRTPGEDKTTFTLDSAPKTITII